MPLLFLIFLCLSIPHLFSLWQWSLSELCSPHLLQVTSFPRQIQAALSEGSRAASTCHLLKFLPAPDSHLLPLQRTGQVQAAQALICHISSDNSTHSITAHQPCRAACLLSVCPSVVPVGRKRAWQQPLGLVVLPPSSPALQLGDAGAAPRSSLQDLHLLFLLLLFKGTIK